MEPVSTDVGVPSLEPGEEGVISVQIIAPQQPGKPIVKPHENITLTSVTLCDIALEMGDVFNHEDVLLKQ